MSSKSSPLCSSSRFSFTSFHLAKLLFSRASFKTLYISYKSCYRCLSGLSMCCCFFQPPNLEVKLHTRYNLEHRQKFKSCGLLMIEFTITPLDKPKYDVIKNEIPCKANYLTLS